MSKSSVTALTTVARLPGAQAQDGFGTIDQAGADPQDPAADFSIAARPAPAAPWSLRPVLAEWVDVDAVPLPAMQYGAERTTALAPLRFDLAGVPAAESGASMGPVPLVQADPIFGAAVNNPFGLTVAVTFPRPSFADIDGDGDLDAFVGEGYGTTKFLRNDGSADAPAFAAAVSRPFNLADVGDQAAPSFADIDADGDLDAFIGNYRGDTKFFLNTGTAAPDFATAVSNPFGLTNVGDFASPSFADIDDDGDLDAFVGNLLGNTQFFLNTGSAAAPNFAAAVINPFGLPKVAGRATPTLADIDGDGDLDAFLGSLFFRNTGSAGAAAFGPAVSNAFRPSELGPYTTHGVADIDADGDLDAFAGTSDSKLQFFFNSSAFALEPPSSIQYTDTAFDDSFATVSRTLSVLGTDSATLTFGIGGVTDNGSTVSKTSAYGVLTVTKSGGAYTFVPNDAGIEALSASASASFTVTASNGSISQSRTLTVSLLHSGITETPGNDTLAGTLGNDRISGLAGNDSLSGGDGNDSLLGGDDSDTLSGGNHNDLLDGGGSADSMTGGAGNDRYVVQTSGDKVIEASGGGSDSVSSSITLTLPSHVENLTLTGTSALNGTGNTANNKLTGNSAANSLGGGEGNDSLYGMDGVDTLTGGNGNDLLDGGVGNDSMTGGAGNDRYVVSGSGDKVIEAAGGGSDSVSSSITYTLPAEIEKLTLTGSSAISGTGNTANNTLTGNTGNNSLSGGEGNDSLSGGDGNDRLDGGNGNDSMTGGAGSDRYVVNSSGDQVVEASGGGSDSVSSGITHTLAAEVEALTLTGSSAINGAGNALNNALTGNTGNNSLSGGNGNDTLTGGAGNDTLTGGAGLDAFRFSSALNGSSNVDRVADFNAVNDRLELDNSVFTKLTTPDALSASNFRASSTGNAADSNDFVLYDTDSGELFYDADGSGAGAKVAVATLSGQPALTSADIFVILPGPEVLTQYAHGRLSTEAPTDRFAVSLTAGETYIFAMTGTGSNNVTDPRLTLFGTNGSTQLAFNDNGLQSNNSIITYTAASTGTHFLDASAKSTSASPRDYGVSMTTGAKADFDVAMGAGVMDSDQSWSTAAGTGATVTYGFRTEAPDYVDLDPGKLNTWSELSAEQKTAFRLALQDYSELTGLRFEEVLQGGGVDDPQLVFSNYTFDERPSGFTYELGGLRPDGTRWPEAGDVWINTTKLRGTSPMEIGLERGSFNFYTVMHEVGHSLGLLHPGMYDSGSGANITYNTHAQFTQDTLKYTVMSYFGEGNLNLTSPGKFPDAPMLHDVLALQNIYGPNLATRSGNTVYGFNSNAGATYDFSLNTVPAFALWDGGGIDTLDLSGFGLANTISLQDGTFSKVNGVEGNLSIAVGTIIENAIGGSNADKITGNNSGNTLAGGNGNDTLAGGNGNDTLAGGNSNDTLSGGSGNDSLTGGAGLDTFRFASAVNGSTNVDRLADFNPVDDRIELENAVFTKFTGAGFLAAANFRASTTGTAADSNDIVLYDTDSGQLFYDSDGSGAGARVLIATLSGLPSLTSADIFVT